MAQQTNVNGVRISFTDLTVEGETSPNNGSLAFFFPKGVLQSASWDALRTPVSCQGNQVGMVGRTNGYGVGTGSFELLVSEADDWISTITSNGSVPLMSVFFNLRFSYSINGVDVRIDSLMGIKITKVGAANQKGNDATTRTFEFSVSPGLRGGHSALWRSRDVTQTDGSAFGVR
jgi:hypothetical protein